MDDIAKSLILMMYMTRKKSKPGVLRIAAVTHCVSFVSDFEVGMSLALGAGGLSYESTQMERL